MVPFRSAVQLDQAGSGPAWRDLARKVEGSEQMAPLFGAPPQAVAGTPVVARLAGT